MGYRCWFVAWACGVLHCTAALLQEDFADDPALRGWQVFGQADLFQWKAAAGHLAVTWDSSRANSYFYRPLGTILTKTDDFKLAFDLQLDDIQVGTTPGKPFTFEVAVALLNRRDATSTNFLRGTGAQSPNLIEFDYFPDSGFGATVSPLIVSSNNQFVPSFTFPFELTTGTPFQVEMVYTALDQTLTTSVTHREESPVTVKAVKLGPSFTDFRIDAIAICSYSDEGAGGSVQARGTLDNVRVVLPEAPVSSLRATFRDGRWLLSFHSLPGWRCTLERTEDWHRWLQVGTAPAGALGEIEIRDEAGVEGNAAFYRVRSERW